MKLFGFLFGMIMANPMMNFLLMDKLSEDGDSDSLMKMLLFSPGLLGQNEEQGNQMNSLLPFLMMESQNENSEMLMMMMMQQPGADMNTMLPLLMMGDDEVDMQSLFLMVRIYSLQFASVFYLDNNDAIELRLNK